MLLWQGVPGKLWWGCASVQFPDNITKTSSLANFISYGTCVGYCMNDLTLFHSFFKLCLIFHLMQSRHGESFVPYFQVVIEAFLGFPTWVRRGLTHCALGQECEKWWRAISARTEEWIALRRNTVYRNRKFTLIVTMSHFIWQQQQTTT